MRFYITNGSGGDLTSAVRAAPVRQGDGTDIYTVSVSAPQARVRIEWTEPMLDHIGVWHPTCGKNRGLPQFFHVQKTESCFFRGAPVLATLRADGRTHRTVALGDAAVSSALGYYVDDFSENDTVVFFLELYGVPAGWAAELRVDKKSAPLPDALGEVWRWWNRAAERAVPLPESAFEPLYSTWYSFHQTPEQAALTEDLKIAADLGFRTVILDDGWQFEGAGTKDYRKTGDWAPAPDKFPDFKGFVRDVHAFGQKLILWFSVPFVGFETDAFRRFREKLLCREEG
jgi:alpha-galactosidase